MANVVSCIVSMRDYKAMQQFRLIEHTADIGLTASGKTLAEAFANTAYGLFSIMSEIDRVHEAESQELSINAEGYENLLFNWMNGLIYVFEIEGLLLKRFDIKNFSKHNLNATCWGERYDPSRHQIKLGVKSATYHMLEVDEDKYKVRVIFDV